MRKRPLRGTLRVISKAFSDRSDAGTRPAADCPVSAPRRLVLSTPKEYNARSPTHTIRYRWCIASRMCIPIPCTNCICIHACVHLKRVKPLRWDTRPRGGVAVPYGFTWAAIAPVLIGISSLLFSYHVQANSAKNNDPFPSKRQLAHTTYIERVKSVLSGEWGRGRGPVERSWTWSGGAVVGTKNRTTSRMNNLESAAHRVGDLGPRQRSHLHPGSASRAVHTTEITRAPPPRSPVRAPPPHPRPARAPIHQR